MHREILGILIAFIKVKNNQIVDTTPAGLWILFNLGAGAGLLFALIDMLLHRSNIVALLARPDKNIHSNPIQTENIKMIRNKTKLTKLKL